MPAAGARRRFEAAAAALGLTLDVRRFRQGTRTADEAAAAVGCELGQIVKSLVFLCDGEPVLALTSGSRRVNTHLLGEVLGGTITRADADAVRRATGFAIGGTPPFGHDRNLRTVVDTALLPVRAGVGRCRDARDRLRDPQYRAPALRFGDRGRLHSLSCFRAAASYVGVCSTAAPATIC
ncbi:MAG: YbaK/EbsC family protein [Acidimicrobiaceae bacterium]|nr:YbaK/EbsC family protein [Acidimicrobiaceae bacterium]MYE76768.1 YbaK/EbsC family protein [Acidimicrobiaceae bacterium]MYJ42745.1 YbaK/EbsC family protein [Acidimicrobiaceae bacterium]